MTGDANDHISTLYNLTIEKDADRTFNSIRRSFFFKRTVVEWVNSTFNSKLLIGKVILFTFT